MDSWDDIRKKARTLENEIDLKLVAISKVSSGATANNSDVSPLLSENVFDNLTEEVEQMLSKLSDLNERMTNLPSTGAAMLHTQSRHRDILHGYRQEFNKIQTNHTIRLEREELLKGSGIGLGSPSTSGLSRRDMYLKESQHMSNSNSLINDQISIAMETKEHLLSQRQSFKRLQTRFTTLSNRFPMISSLIQRINIKKRRDTVILGAVIMSCTILMLLYAFH